MPHRFRPSLDLAVIGNCSIGALVDSYGRVVWACLPAFDGDPWFSALLGGESPTEGFFAIELKGCQRSEQEYRRNSAVLVTRLYAEDGSAIEITDCIPRSKLFDRTFRPTALARRVRPISGTPQIRVVIPLNATARSPRSFAPAITLHRLGHDPALYSTAPMAYILPGAGFFGGRYLTEPRRPDQRRSSHQPHDRQTDAWRDWVRRFLPRGNGGLRAAITLKLCTYRRRSVAALTTSIDSRLPAQLGLSLLLAAGLLLRSASTAWAPPGRRKAICATS